MSAFRDAVMPVAEPCAPEPAAPGPSALEPSPPEPGRFCPADYRLGARAFLAQPEFESDCLYVAGGLYGNTLALDALLALYASEAADRPALVFNGDFHWFDIDPAQFQRIERLTAPHRRLRGNVETELARAPLAGDSADDAGCGCAYPDDVDDGVVERSNRILARLRDTARAGRHAAALGALPMVARVRVAGVGVAITHGDEESLAGWRLANDRLGESWGTGLAQCLHDLDAQVMASSHTCLAVADTLEDRGRVLAAINNGAAGLANFAGSHAGLVTRIARHDLGLPPGARELYAARVGETRISALAIDFDRAAWLACFDAQWPADSEAARSYRERAVQGTALQPEAAARGGFVARPVLAQPAPAEQPGVQPDVQPGVQRSGVQQARA